MSVKRAPKALPLLLLLLFCLLILSFQQPPDTLSFHSVTNVTQPPLLTLVLTTHNVLPVLNRTIDTLILPKRVVLLVVDDASTDGTLQTLTQRLPNHPILSISSNTLGGVGTPSNLAMDNVRTKYVAFLDGDDLLTSSTLSNMLSLAEKTNAQVVLADFTRFRESPSGTTVEFPSYDRERWPTQTVLRHSQTETVNFTRHKMIGMSPVPWRKLYNMQFLRDHAIQFPEGDFVFEDNAVHWLVAAHATRIAYLNQSVVAHRLGREGQSTSTFRGKRRVLQEEEDIIKTRKSRAGMVHYLANQNFVGFRLMECDNDMWTCNSVRAKFLHWVTGSDWVNIVVSRAGDDKINEKFRSVKSRLAKYWAETMLESFPDTPKSRLQTPIPHVEQAPELSIVVPVFNDLEFVDSFINNLSQLKVSHEIIFVDNNSTDGSVSHLERVTQNFEHMLLLHTSKAGAGRARNLGLLFAEGDHVMFLDCDDTFNTSALEAAVHHAQKTLAEVTFLRYGLDYLRRTSSTYTLRKRTGMFSSDTKLFNLGLSVESLSKRREASSTITNYPWNKLVRRDLLIRENIFFGSTLVNNDVLFHWDCVLTARSITFYDGVVTRHRKFEGGDRITDTRGGERLELADALAMTNRVLVKKGLNGGMVDRWQEFVKRLLKWGRDRVGERWITEFDRRSEIVKRIVAEGRMDLILRD